MTDRILFVDLENIQTLNLAHVPADACVRVFYGILQKKLPEALVVQAQPFGVRLKWIKIAGQGPNALDFHIAFYLGLELAHRPKTESVILSRDKGFDPLVRHLQSLGHECRRSIALSDAFPDKEPVADTDHFTRLVALLKKEKSRPSKRKGLAGKVKSWFPRLSENVQQALIERLFEESRIQESEKLLTYHL